MNAKEKAIKEHNEDKDHPNWKETCEVCIDNVIKELLNDEINNINKFLERLKGYGCGYHKQLEKQMLNRIKELRHLSP